MHCRAHPSCETSWCSYHWRRGRYIDVYTCIYLYLYTCASISCASNYCIACSIVQVSRHRRFVLLCADWQRGLESFFKLRGSLSVESWVGYCQGPRSMGSIRHAFPFACMCGLDVRKCPCAYLGTCVYDNVWGGDFENRHRSSANAVLR